jgi:hypothetical protein
LRSRRHLQRGRIRGRNALSAHPTTGTKTFKQIQRLSFFGRKPSGQYRLTNMESLSSCDRTTRSGPRVIRPGATELFQTLRLLSKPCQLWRDTFDAKWPLQSSRKTFRLNREPWLALRRAIRKKCIKLIHMFDSATCKRGQRVAGTGLNLSVESSGWRSDGLCVRALGSVASTVPVARSKGPHRQSRLQAPQFSAPPDVIVASSGCFASLLSGPDNKELPLLCFGPAWTLHW